MYVDLDVGTDEEMKMVIERIHSSEYTLSITSRLKSWLASEAPSARWLMVDPESMSVEFRSRGPKPDEENLIVEPENIIDHGIDGAAKVVDYIDGGNDTFKINDDGEIEVLRNIYSGATISKDEIEGLLLAKEVSDDLRR